MAQEGGYAVSGQFKSIADNASAAVLSVQQLSKDFLALGTAVAGIASAVKSFGELQQTLVLTNTVAQGNSIQLQQMNTAVREMALNYKFSANEGAQALYFLAGAGFSVGESLRAMSGVTLLAQGTLSSLDSTADTVANTIVAFGLAANDSMRIANLFAASISVTQATMDKLSYSMRYVAPVAASMGASVEQTTVALSLLYNAGNRGQQSGTLLRDILVRLVNPSKEASEVLSQLGISILDDTGHVRNFVDVLKEMSSLNLSPVTLSKIFEQRGVSGAETLLASFDPAVFGKKMKDADFAEQVGVIAKNANIATSSIKNMYDLMTAAMTHTQFATKLALEQNNTLSGSFARAKNALTELGITVGEQLAPGLSALAGSISDLVKGFRSMDEGTKDLIAKLPLLVVVGMAVNKAFGGISTAATSVVGGMSAIGGAVNQFKSAKDAMDAVRGSMQQLVTTQGQLLRQTPRGLQVAGPGALPLGGYINTNRVGTMRQVDYEYQQQRRQYAQNVALGRPAGPPPTAPLDMGAARQGAISAASGVAGAVLGVAGSLVTIILGIISLGTLAAVAWPFVRDYLNSKPGTSDVGAPVVMNAKQDVQAILSTPSANLEKLDSFEGMISDNSNKYEFWQKMLNERIERTKDAKKALVEYVAAQLDLNGESALAAKVRKDGDTKLVDALARGTGAAGVMGPGALAAGIITQSDEYKKLSKDANDARASADVAAKNVTSYADYIGYVNDAFAQLAGTKDTQKEQAKQKVLSMMKVKQESDEVIVVINGWIDNLANKSRDAQISAAKAAAEISQNPIDKYVAEIVKNQLSVIDKITTAGDDIRKKFDTQIGSQVNSLFPEKFRQQVGAVLGGLDWVEKIADETGVQKVTHSGVAEKLKQGMDPQQIFDEYMKTIDELMANIPKGQAQLRAALEKMRNAAIADIKSALLIEEGNRVKALVAMMETVHSNQEFGRKITTTFEAYNNDFLSAVDAAIGGTVPQLRMRIDFTNLNKALGDRLAEIKKEQLELFKRLGGTASGITPDQVRAISAQAQAITQPSIDAAQNAYIEQAQNIIKGVQQAQLRIKNETQNALLTAAVTQSQINSDLVELYAKMGVQIPKSVFQSAADLGFNQATQRVQQQLAQLSEKLLLLKQQRDELQRLSDNPQLLTQGAKPPPLPLSMVGGPAEQMAEALKRGTDDFQQRFGLNLKIFNDSFSNTLNAFLQGLGTTLGKGGVQVPALTGGASFSDRFGGMNKPANTPFNDRFNGTGLPSYITNGTSAGSGGSSAIPFANATVNIQGGTVGFSSGSSQSLIDAVAKLESNNSPIDGPSGRYANFRYQQFKGFVDQYGFGADGVTNYAQQVLNKNPNATFGDFYGGYVTGTGNPARADVNSLLTTTQPGAQGAYENMMKNSPIAPNTPLSSLLNQQQNTPLPDTTKIAEATQLWQQYAEATGIAKEKSADFSNVQTQVNDSTGQTTEQINTELDRRNQLITKYEEQRNSLEQLKSTQDAWKASPDGQDVANWEQYSKAVQAAASTVAGSNDMFKGLQVANAQLTLQLGRDAKLMSDTYQTAANSIATNLTALITGTQKDWRVALKNIATDIATTIIKALILRALTGLGGSLFGSPGGIGPTGAPSLGLFNAKGNAFDNGGVVNFFANGGIFDQPTAFNFGPGGSKKGILGEQGPEAVMPLVRGPDGKLAVRALSTPITPIATLDRGSPSGGMSYSPNFHFYGGDGQSSPTPTGNSRQERNRMIAMQKELDSEMEATFMRVAAKHSRSGGFLNPSAQRLGIAGNG